MTIMAKMTTGTRGAMSRPYYELPPPYLDLHQYRDEFCDDYNDKVERRFS